MTLRATIYARHSSDQQRDDSIEDQVRRVVREIFADYAAGLSPKRITHQLNAERTPGPRGGTWGS